MKKVAMLCSRCQPIFSGSYREALDTSEKTTHHQSASSFYAAANEGCRICLALLHLFFKDGQIDLPQFRTAKEFTGARAESSVRSDGAQLESYIVTIALVEEVRDKLQKLDNDEPWVMQFFLQPLQDVDVRLQQGGLDPFTGSEKCWSQAVQWFDQCVNDHGKCRQPRSPSSWYPTRLLDVRSASDLTLRLCITAEDRPSGPYMTLSHCWGKIQIIRLLESNINDLRKIIPLDALPPTFAETIQVIRRFGVRYLWIDSLCIIQDSTEDWRREAGLMQEVYSNSMCNIAATGSRNSQEGLFRWRDTDHVKPCIIDANWTGKGDEKYIVMDQFLWAEDVQKAPLNLRGWVLQERVLAPRVLHFGQRQLLWECRERDACETYPDRLPSLISYLTGFKHDILLFAGGTDGSPDSTRREPLDDPDTLTAAYRFWSRTVQAYMRCGLTKEEDKLIAISGVAKRMRDVLNDTYLAGLWQRFLPSQLLWRVEDSKQIDGSASYRPRTYRAPSWSWASIEANILDGWIYNSGLMIPIEDAQITPLTDDDTGQLRDGVLRIKGTIYAAHVENVPPPYGFLELLLDDEYHNGNDDDDGQGERELDALVYPDVPCAYGLTPLYCLPIRRDETSKKGPQVDGLLLVPANGRPQGWYSRFGAFTVDGDACGAFESDRGAGEGTDSLYCSGFAHSVVII